MTQRLVASAAHESYTAGQRHITLARRARKHRGCTPLAVSRSHSPPRDVSLCGRYAGRDLISTSTLATCACGSCTNLYINSAGAASAAQLM